VPVPARPGHDGGPSSEALGAGLPAVTTSEPPAWSEPPHDEATVDAPFGIEIPGTWSIEDPPEG
jgi:hypothetical protein